MTSSCINGAPRATGEEENGLALALFLCVKDADEVMNHVIPPLAEAMQLMVGFGGVPFILLTVREDQLILACRLPSSSFSLGSPQGQDGETVMKLEPVFSGRAADKDDHVQIEDFSCRYSPYSIPPPLPDVSILCTTYKTKLCLRLPDKWVSTVDPVISADMGTKQLGFSRFFPGFCYFGRGMLKLSLGKPSDDDGMKGKGRPSSSVRLLWKKLNLGFEADLHCFVEDPLSTADNVVVLGGGDGLLCSYRITMCSSDGDEGGATFRATKIASRKLKSGDWLTAARVGADGTVVFAQTWQNLLWVRPLCAAIGSVDSFYQVKLSAPITDILPLPRSLPSSVNARLRGAWLISYDESDTALELRSEDLKDGLGSLSFGGGAMGMALSSEAAIRKNAHARGVWTEYLDDEAPE